jgi:sugar phosphate permease
MSTTSIATNMKSAAANPDFPTTTEDVDDTAGKMSDPAAPGAVEAFNPGWRFYLAFLSLTTITLMVALDATSLSVALPIMARALGGSAMQAFWSGTSFLLTSTVFQPVIGSFSEIFGRKPMLYASLALFGAGAIIAALAHDFNLVLVGRSIQGVGGGGVITLTEIVVTDLVPLRVRGQWFSFVTSAWALGSSKSLPRSSQALTTHRNRRRPTARRWFRAKR